MTTTVGLIGPGRMGLPIVGHLVRKGFSVIAYDIDPAKRAAVQAKGAQWAEQLSELAEKAEFVLICVGFDREVKELLGPNGGLNALKRGTIVAILSTIHPHTVQALATEATARGVEVIDSTVCRGGAAADAGTLLSFVGGSADAVERITPVLQAYSSDVVHSGGVGTAQVSKAVNNLMLWACLVASHEGLALAQRYNVDIEVLRKALMISSATNGALGNWGRQTMAWAQDDMAIVGAMADDCKISLPQAGVVREICRTLKPRCYQLDKYGQ
jgi:3-hydroxyisobutyrate dehydrogenase